MGLALGGAGIVLGILSDRRREGLQGDLEALRRLEQLEEYPDANHLEQMEEGLERLAERVGRRQGKIPGAGFEARLAPVESRETLFLDLVMGEERLRRYCLEKEVEGPADGHFGFGEAIQSKELRVPEGLSGEAVDQWLSEEMMEGRLIEMSVRALIESEPERIEGVERMIEGKGRQGDGEGAELFEDFVRLEFVGRTETLRRFILKLRALDCPVVIGDLEVEPLKFGTKGMREVGRSEKMKTEKGGTIGGGLEDDMIAIVPRNASRFKVVIGRYGLGEGKGWSDE